MADRLTSNIARPQKILARATAETPEAVDFTRHVVPRYHDSQLWEAKATYATGQILSVIVEAYRGGSFCAMLFPTYELSHDRELELDQLFQFLPPIVSSRISTNSTISLSFLVSWH